MRRNSAGFAQHPKIGDIVGVRERELFNLTDQPGAERVQFPGVNHIRLKTGNGLPEFIEIVPADHTNIASRLFRIFYETKTPKEIRLGYRVR